MEFHSKICRLNERSGERKKEKKRSIIHIQYSAHTERNFSTTKNQNGNG